MISHPSSVVLPVAQSKPVPVDESDAPNDLTLDERHVWLRLAPHALGNGTLVPAHAEAFNRLCRNIVLERRYANSPTDAGGANHRGLIQRIDAESLMFRLAPTGKEEEAQTFVPAVDPLKDKYFGSGRNGA